MKKICCLLIKSLKAWMKNFQRDIGYFSSYAGFHLKGIITWGCFSNALILIFSHFFTPFKFSNLIFIFVDYGNTIGLLTGYKNKSGGNCCKMFSHMVFIYTICSSFMTSFRFFNIKHWVVYLVSSYLFSEKYILFNVPPQAYRKKGDSNVICLLFSRNWSWFWARWFQVFITTKQPSKQCLNFLIAIW